MQTSMMIGDNSKCYNHPDKKGEYFLESNPSKKFCLKCNLTLNGGNNSTFITKESNSYPYQIEQQKKQILDQFRE
jgi:hypothetical protein